MILNVWKAVVMTSVAPILLLSAQRWSDPVRVADASFVADIIVNADDLATTDACARADFDPIASDTAAFSLDCGSEGLVDVHISKPGSGPTLDAAIVNAVLNILAGLLTRVDCPPCPSDAPTNCPPYVGINTSNLSVFGQPLFHEGTWYVVVHYDGTYLQGCGSCPVE